MNLNRMIDHTMLKADATKGNHHPLLQRSEGA